MDAVLRKVEQLEKETKGEVTREQMDLRDEHKKHNFPKQKHAAKSCTCYICLAARAAKADAEEKK
jgi:hypothetical protein